MTLLVLEGFDDGLAALRHPQANGAVDAAYGKNGKGMRVGDSYSAGFRSDLSADTTQTFGAWLKVVLLGGRYMCGFINGQDWNVGWSVAVQYDNLNNRLQVRDRTGWTYGAINTVYEDTWYYVELQATFHDTTGSWELRVDGATYLSATSRDTMYSGIPTNIMFGSSDTDAVDSMYVDDFYHLDSTGSFNNDFLGICKVVELLPDGNGNSSDMLGSDADKTDNHLLVDNNAAVPPATAEYVGSAVEGEKDTYSMDDLPGTPVVHGVQVSVYAVKSDSGAKWIRPVLRSGSTDYVGTSVALSEGTHIPVDELWEVDPDTATTWLYGGVNAMNVGQEVRDS